MIRDHIFRGKKSVISFTRNLIQLSNNKIRQNAKQIISNTTDFDAKQNGSRSKVVEDRTEVTTIHPYPIAGREEQQYQTSRQQQEPFS
ncbi:unnamed protein product [Prunus armeniaca]|uniref:Uncharacterized protein n=1 Tax=Prunus armeniaca TaxID=36596 RepID=A0A6J5VHV2_PRUAR|nr:unnamed protein product [Prunus armeniaca]CAB4318863.1 unnamed protein product [Prunus armeniaca]